MAGDAKKLQPIIVKKVRKGGHAPHGGAWKIAYADFVTAMMAFFLLLWLLNVLFFLGGVIYVKYRVRGLLAHRAFRGPAERAAFAWPVLAYHLLLPLFLAALIAASSASLLVLVAFTPAILRASALLLHLGQKFPIKRLGWSEVGHALLFATLLVIALR